MKIADIGVIIAEREIDGYAGDKPCKVVIKIGKPFKEEADGSCWYCPYSINAPGNDRKFYGAGIDSLQALKLAISNIKAELGSLYSSFRLSWNGETDLGF